MYSSTISLTSAVDEAGESRPGHFTPGERDPVPTAQEAGWERGPVWTGAENVATTGIRSPDRPVCSESLHRLSYTGQILCCHFLAALCISGLDIQIPLELTLVNENNTGIS